MKLSKQIESNTFKKRTVFVVAGIVVTLLTTGYLLFSEDYEDTPIINMSVDDDTMIQLGKHKVMAIDPDTAKSPVALKGRGH
jgi:hypothetical protein